MIRNAGLLGFLGFVFFIGGTVLAGLLNPVFWLFYAIWLVASAANFDPLFPQFLLFLCLFNLLAGNGAFTYLHDARADPARLASISFRSALRCSAYWVLISVAAYRGLWQLFRDPFFWEKTQHGVSRHSAAVASDCAAPAGRQGCVMNRAVEPRACGRAARLACVRGDAGACRGRGAQRAGRRRHVAAVGGRQHRRRRQVPIGRIVAGYPTLPFLATTLVAWLAPAGTPAPALVAAALFALIAAFCFSSFRKAGLPYVAAVVVTLLIALHPALLRAVIAGPADMFLAAFLLMFCLALYDLRARSGTSEVMACRARAHGACVLAPGRRSVCFRRGAVSRLCGPSRRWSRTPH